MKPKMKTEETLPQECKVVVEIRESSKRSSCLSILKSQHSMQLSFSLLLNPNYYLKRQSKYIRRQFLKNESYGFGLASVQSVNI